MPPRGRRTSECFLKHFEAEGERKRDVCNATGKIPVNFDITAKEVTFGGDVEKLDFTVIRSHTFSWATICPEVGLSGGSTSPTVTNTDTFTLQPENGASKTFTSIGPNWTYTLKVR